MGHFVTGSSFPDVLKDYTTFIVIVQKIIATFLLWVSVCIRREELRSRHGGHGFQFGP